MVHSAPHKIDPYCVGNPDVCIGGALDEAYLSKKGAFNGSGIALAGESWNKDQRKIFTLYFQHWTGDIRFMQYTTDKKWIGGTKTETVATDAKNSTPISAVAYASNGQQFVRTLQATSASGLKLTFAMYRSSIYSMYPKITQFARRQQPTSPTSGRQDLSVLLISRPGTLPLLACKHAGKAIFTATLTFRNSQRHLERQMKHLTITR